jgi:hypothetical protein
MIPARYRGRVDIGVNGTYWAGSIIGGLVELLLGVPAQQQPLEAVARPLSAVAPLSKAAYSPGMLPSGTGTSAAA